MYRIEAKDERIESLKGRTERCRCKYCGGQLELRRIIYGDIENARVEIFCRECDRIEYGIEKEIYQIARYFVEEMDFNAYPDLDYSETTKQMSIAKTCEIITWGCKNLKLLDGNGFRYPVEIESDMDGETMRIGDKKLEELMDMGTE